MLHEMWMLGCTFPFFKLLFLLFILCDLLIFHVLTLDIHAKKGASPTKKFWPENPLIYSTIGLAVSGEKVKAKFKNGDDFCTDESNRGFKGLINEH